jgi:hypothetical protein
VTSCSFLTSHARVLLCVARDRARGCRHRSQPGHHRAQRIVTDLTAAGYVVKHKDGRRNRYQVQAHLPLPEPPPANPPVIGELLALLAGAAARPQLTGTRPG